MKLSSKSLLAATVGALVLSGCANHGDAPITAKDLEGHRWQLVKIDDQAVKADPRNSTPFLQFSEKMMASGNAGCNDFFGQGELKKNNQFRIEKMSMTMKMCIGDVMDSEFSVQQSLGDWNKVTLKENVLTLKNDVHTLEFKEVAKK